MHIHSAIVKGPNKKNLHDTLGIFNQKYFSLLVVADGLGSAKHSDFGAKQAVIAVQKAVNQWRNLKKQENKVLIRLIHFFWNMLIEDSEFKKEECLTTCLFAYIDKKEHKIIFGQLGDGLIHFNSQNQTVSLKLFEDYNYTKSLGSSKSFSDWNMKIVSYNPKSFSVFLASDGVSEDIEENKESNFVEVLINDLAKLKKKKRNKYLKQLLENWPTKYHNDDKTICIAWEKKK